MKKRLLAVLLTVAMLLSMCPITVSASGTTAGGTCGDNLTWTLEDGVLTISGSGDMANWTESGSPWYDYRKEIQTVVIQEGATSIGNYAFENCISLTSVTLPEGLKAIEPYAFASCSGLESINFPESLQSIGTYAFSNCKSLKSIVLPDEMELIDEAVFIRCSSLSSVTLPSHLKSIRCWAFQSCFSLEHIILPDGLEEIYGFAFYDCTSMKGIEIPASVTVIGEDAVGRMKGSVKKIPNFVIYGKPGTHAEKFARMKAINFIPVCIYGHTWENGAEGTTVCMVCGETDTDDIPTAYHSWENDTATDDAATSGTCGDNLTWTLEDGVLTISGSGDMDNWQKTAPWNPYRNEIQSVVIAQGVTSVGDYSFYQYEQLSSVSLPSGLTTIGAYAFQECNQMESIRFPAGLTTIGIGAFQGCRFITLDFPAGLTTIERTAFNGCDLLTSVTFPEGLTTIGAWAFCNCRLLAEVTFPAGLKEIGSYAFYDCIHLSKATFPAGLTTIGDYAFYECFGQESSITFLGGLKSIGSYAFYNCVQLNSVTFPDGLETIGEQAFCFTSVKSVALPASVTTIGENALGYGDIGSVYASSKIYNFTIYGEPGTAAEAYATENEFEFSSVTGEDPEPGVEPSPEPEEETEPITFTDVPESLYYAQPVAWAVAAGVTQGTSDTTFSPDDSCTRAQVVTFLWRAAGEPEPTTTENPFTDVKDGAYYYKAVLWAVEKGITDGMSDTTFEPDGTCTRGQVVTFLYRYAGEPKVSTADSPFTDVKAGAYYEKAVAWAVSKEITNGMSDTTFEPNRTCTRGQVVTFLYRAVVGV